MIDQCNSILVDFDSIANGRRCIFVYGHGGEHYYPTDNSDHTDEIRLRVVLDREDKLKQRVTELEADIKQIEEQRDDISEEVSSFRRKVNEQRMRIESLEATLAENEDQHGKNWRVKAGHLEEYVTELEAALEEAQKSINRHGIHKQPCAQLQRRAPGEALADCTCGLDAAHERIGRLTPEKP